MLPHTFRNRLTVCDQTAGHGRTIFYMNVSVSYGYSKGAHKKTSAHA